MRKILIATYGYLANGIKISIEILCGKKENISYINAYVDDTNIDEGIKKFFNNLKSEDEAVILTDILGGSVNQKLMFYCNYPNVHVIAGFNLAIVLEMILAPEPLCEEDVMELVKNCSEQLVYLNQEGINEQKEEDFF